MGHEQFNATDGRSVGSAWRRGSAARSAVFRGADQAPQPPVSAVPAGARLVWGNHHLHTRRGWSSRSTTASVVTWSATRVHQRPCIPGRCGRGSAWNASDATLVWSDIPNNARCAGSKKTATSRSSAPLRIQQRQHVRLRGTAMSCEHGGRRVVRYEPSGRRDGHRRKYQGKRLNSPTTPLSSCGTHGSHRPHHTAFVKL